MLRESSRALGFLPQFSKFLRARPIGANKLFSTAVSPQSEDLKPVKQETSQTGGFDKLRFWYPEFLPNPNVKRRNLVREKLERRDMLRRRNVLHIPEFYVGSVVAVTTADKHVPNKQARNVIENQGVEIMYYLYSPVIQRIEVLRLEKRLDNELLYLRDAPNEYSTFQMDMQKEYRDESHQVPINTLKVPLNPRPWLQRYERMDLKGAILPELSEKILRKAKAVEKPWEKYDLMDEYRKVIPKEEQEDIFAEICNELKQLELKRKTEKRKKVFIKPKRQTLF